MAEESIHASLTPEIIVPDRGNLRSGSVGKPITPNGGQNKRPDYRRASTGSYQFGGNTRKNSTEKLTFPINRPNILPHHIRASTGTFHAVLNSGRNPTGKPKSPNSGENYIPHYLRASTGSCHDFCKYGIKHAVEVKERRPIPKRVIKPPSEKQIPTESGVLAGRKTIKVVVKPNTSPVSETLSPDSPKERVTKPPLDKQNPPESGVPAERKTIKEVVKPKPSLLSETISSDSPKILKQEVSSPSKKVEVSSRQASSSKKKTAKNEKKIFSEKFTPTAKPKTITVRPSSSLDTSEGLSGRRNSEDKIGKKTGTSKAPVKKVFALPAASLSPKPSIKRVVSLNVKKYRSLKLLSPLKDQNRIRKAERKQPNNEKVPEKTLHAVKVETENGLLQFKQNGSSTIQSPPSPSLSSPKSPSLLKSSALSVHEEEAAQEEFEYTDSEADESTDSISESDLHHIETSDGNCNGATRKCGVVQVSEDKYCSPVKLMFRRGKVVELQSENSGPRKLRFRRGTVLGEKQDGKADVQTQRRSLKKGGGGDDTNGTNADSEKVPLRHQSAQGKKDLQGLFDNVIEETATELVESTKNKVLQSTQTGHTLHSPPSLLLSPPNSSSHLKSTSLLFHEEEAQEEFECTDSEAVDSDDSNTESSEIVDLHIVEASDRNCNRATRKAGVGFSDDIDCAPMKLKFRRGKVVDLQSENSGPRRLRFRRGRVLGENYDGKADVRRRNYRKREVDNTNGTNTDSKIVVLRHQDMQGKKDAQGLFNNVIEETASKLVESRKSKVKALVGAFETVISLQESKPATPTVI